MAKQNDNLETIEQDKLKAHYDFDYGKAKPNRFAAQFDQAIFLEGVRNNHGYEAITDPFQED